VTQVGLGTPILTDSRGMGGRSYVLTIFLALRPSAFLV
jgi:hypothetical protein